MTLNDATTIFERTTRLVPDPAVVGRFESTVDPAWSSLRGVLGGYLAALMVRAAEACLCGPVVRTITIGFLRAGAAEPATLAVETVRAGRAITVLGVTLTQAHGMVATARITTITPTMGTEWDAPADLEIAPLERCVEGVPPGVRHFDHAIARFDPAGIPLTHGDRARVAGYVRPIEPGPIDAAWLTMLLDWFPPAAFVRFDPPTGGVSVDYTVHLHRTLDALGAKEWLRGTFEVERSVAGLALEHGIIAGPGDVVLAESFHTRWTG